MAHLIAAIVMTLSLLEGHSPFASLFKCDFWYLWESHGPSASAELLVFILSACSHSYYFRLLNCTTYALLLLCSRSVCMQ